VPRSLVDALAEHVAGKNPDDLVFTTPRGDVMRNHNFRSRVFARGCLVAASAATPHRSRHVLDRLALTDHRQHGAIPLLSHAQLPHARECQESTEVGVNHQPKH
jgi:hypothetical protein